MLRSFCFTLNNPYDNGGATICDWLEENCDYVVVGFERGDSGTFHWQGYAELKKLIRLNTMLKRGFAWHIERRRGSQKQAIDYCKKDGRFLEHGRANKQGHRSDLDRVRESALTEGMRGVTCWANSAGIRVAEKFLEYNEPERDEAPLVIYIHGPSGSGKSLMARDIVKEHGLSDDCYVKNVAGKWWDGYDGHKAVILDDFRDDWFDFTYFLGLTDRYRFRVEKKGSSREMRALLIIITSVHSPITLYSSVNEDKLQINRRIGRVIELGPSVSDVSEVGGGNTKPPLLDEYLECMNVDSPEPPC